MVETWVSYWLKNLVLMCSSTEMAFCGDDPRSASDEDAGPHRDAAPPLSSRTCPVQLQLGSPEDGQQPALPIGDRSLKNLERLLSLADKFHLGQLVRPVYSLTLLPRRKRGGGRRRALVKTSGSPGLLLLPPPFFPAMPTLWCILHREHNLVKLSLRVSLWFEHNLAHTSRITFFFLHLFSLVM